MSTRNITKAYRASSEFDREEGEGWYERAKAYAATLSDDVDMAVGVIAALSPLVPWDRNMIMADQMINGGFRLPMRLCVTDNMIKAARIINGESPLDVLSGEKVRAFYLNIMGIDSDEAVTIDRHAMMVAENRRIDGKSLKFTKAMNRKYADEYRRAAVILSREFGRTITPSQVQATVWVAWRRNGGAFHYRSEAA